MKLVRILSFVLCLTLLFSSVGMIGSFARIDPCTAVPDTDKHTVIDFFESVGASEAVAIIKADKMKSTKLGNKLDATNLNNLANAVQVIRDVNIYRAKEAKLEKRNLPELKVTHRLMANAIINCNYSSFVRGHANNYEKGYRVIAECLAWGAPDPALMWYDYPGYSEKEFFKKGDHGNNKDGHYINLYVDSKSYASAHDYQLAGAGVSMYPNVNKNGWCCCIMTATGYQGDKAFSVDEYSKLVIDYIDSITEDPEETVPEVKKNDPLKDVKDKLEKLGFNVKTQGVADSSVGEGKVIKIEPAPGTKLPKGSTVTIYFAKSEKGIKGDATEDGNVLADDARLVLRASAGLVKLSDSQKWAADVDEDDKVLADDARQILRFSAKMQDSFKKKK